MTACVSLHFPLPLMPVGDYAARAIVDLEEPDGAQRRYEVDASAFVVPAGAATSWAGVDVMLPGVPRGRLLDAAVVLLGPQDFETTAATFAFDDAALQGATAINVSWPGVVIRIESAAATPSAIKRSELHDLIDISLAAAEIPSSRRKGYPVYEVGEALMLPIQPLNPQIVQARALMLIGDWLTTTLDRPGALRVMPSPEEAAMLTDPLSRTLLIAFGKASTRDNLTLSTQLAEDLVRHYVETGEIDRVQLKERLTELGALPAATMDQVLRGIVQSREAGNAGELVRYEPLADVPELIGDDLLGGPDEIGWSDY